MTFAKVLESPVFMTAPFPESRYFMLRKSQAKAQGAGHLPATAAGLRFSWLIFITNFVRCATAGMQLRLF
jgi:hypothetical protein